MLCNGRFKQTNKTIEGISSFMHFDFPVSKPRVVKTSFKWQLRHCF